MRLSSLLLCFALVLPASAAELTLERIFGDPALSGPTPRAVQVSPDGTRVSFVRGRADDQHQLDLWEYNLADKTTRLLVDSRQLLPDEHLSDAEKARRERERTADFHGILGYDWAPDGQRLLFPLGGDLYLYDLRTHSARRLTQGEGAALDPKVSPKGGYVSFVRDQNLYVIDLRTGETRRLTRDGGGTVHNAEAEFVAQEEFAQSSGYWWAPDDSAIAFKRFDEAPVPVARRFEIYADRTEVVEQRYPGAGAANVIVQLGLVSPKGGDPRFVDLGPDADIYLVRVDWTADAKTLAFQRLARSQQQLDLVGVESATLAQTPLLSESSKTWINVNDDLHFLKHTPAFVWASERSGYKQLSLVGLDGKPLRALTLGDWNVDEVLAVDEKAGLVYFSSNKDSLIERQLYTVRLDGRDAASPKRISRGEGIHSPKFAEGADRVSLYVDSFSNPTTPPQTSIHAADGTQLAWIEQNRLDPAHPYAPYLDRHVVPEYGQIDGEDGEPLQYQLSKPPGFDPAKRYPVFVRVYGGPHVQQVQRGWPNLIDEYMAQQGYLVFTLDNRGSARRSRAFTDAIYHRLGEVEVRDQLAGIRWLKTQPYVDGAHVGVFGWSYGGYMTLMLLAKGSGDIAAGAAVAPVTDWMLYDTAYTERYLGLPRDNAQGYQQSSVFAWLDGLSSPLLLAHGMADDNVLFTNSTRLMSDLQKRELQFRLMTYPGAKHGLSTPQMKVHVYTAIKQFMDEKLKAPVRP
jgi:dipeptidyl-peptidase-4